MRTLTAALLAEQKKPSRKPVIKVEVQEYGHPAKAASMQWGTFGWELLHSDTTTKGFHGVALPSDGSLNRIRLDNTTIYHQRVVNPGPDSDYSTWTNLGGTIASSHLAIAAHGSEVIVVAAGASTLYRIESSNSGASWASWVNMTNARPCERGCAIAYKPNGDCAIVHASDVNDPNSLYIQTRTSGTWSTGLGQRAGDYEIEALTMYYDGDWNIIALVIDGNYLSVVRMVYGDGYRVTAGSWASDVKISLGRARIDIPAQMALRQFLTQWWGGSHARHTPTYWEKHQAVLEALSGEALDVSGPSITKPPSYPALLSLARQNEPWIFRLRPGSDFYDGDFDKSDTINTLASYGLAVDCDDTYIYATQANQVWRSELPSFWSPPTTGTGAGDLVTLNASRITRITETVYPEQQCELLVEFDNADGS